MELRFRMSFLTLGLVVHLAVDFSLVSIFQCFRSIKDSNNQNKNTIFTINKKPSFPLPWLRDCAENECKIYKYSRRSRNKLSRLLELRTQLLFLHFCQHLWHNNTDRNRTTKKLIKLSAVCGQKTPSVYVHDFCKQTV